MLINLNNINILNILNVNVDIFFNLRARKYNKSIINKFKTNMNLKIKAICVDILENWTTFNDYYFIIFSVLSRFIIFQYIVITIIITITATTTTTTTTTLLDD